jgi:hypothetical protein
MNFICEILPKGKEFVECDSKLNSFQILDDSFQNTSQQIPLYFILSPGANIVNDVNRLATKMALNNPEIRKKISEGGKIAQNKPEVKEKNLIHLKKLHENKKLLENNKKIGIGDMR